MQAMEGFLDARLFPYLNLEFPGQEDLLPVHIDTGFNRELLIPRSLEYILGEALRWEGDYLADPEKITYADGREEAVDSVYVKIKWFGSEREVIAHIMTDEKWKWKKKILLGTELLADCTLDINFPERRVRITKP